MKRTNTERVLGLLLALCLLFTSGVTAVFAASAPTQQQAYERMIALRSDYPEGMRWTNADYYAWKGGAGYTGGYGCAGFAFLLSDAAFGDLPARVVRPVNFSEVRVGDILRVNNNSHSVIVLTVGTDSLTVAEGNYNSSVHWGRTLTAGEVERADYLMTRYPQGDTAAPSPSPTAAPTPPTPAPSTPSDPLDSLWDVRDDWSRAGIGYCVARGLMNGVGSNRFDPDGDTSRGMLMTILARLNGVSTSNCSPWYRCGMAWAQAAGVSDGADPNRAVTREEFVTMLWRCANCPPAGVSALSRFSDGGAVHDWARQATAWAVRNGILQGNGSALDPRGCTTRAQAAALLMRYCQTCSK